MSNPALRRVPTTAYPPRVSVIRTNAPLVGLLSCVLLLWAGQGQALEFERLEGSELGIPVEYQGNPPYGGGVALEDFDGDQVLDLITVGGLGDGGLVYYQGMGPFSWKDNTEASGLGQNLGQEKGLAVADYDRDGDLDLFVAVWNSGFSRLYQNDGNGHFTEVRSFPEPYVSTGAWGDYDGDGDLDLYLSTYFKSPNALYRNEGGFFVDVTMEAGVSGLTSQGYGNSFQGIWEDLDLDGDLDLYVSNDRCYSGSPANYHFDNQGDGTFAEVGESVGSGLCMNAMGVGVGDYDRNGFSDLYITNTTQGHALLRNHCGSFTEVGEETGTTVGQVGWGVLFEDFDNDGWDDLFVAHAGYGQTPSENGFFLNTGTGGFVEQAEEVGVQGGESNTTGVARADMDGDGDLDLLVVNVNGGGIEFYRNEGVGGNWLQLRFEDAMGGVTPYGVIAEVYAAGVRQRKALRHSAEYLSTGQTRLFFGFGQVESVERVIIYWPSGTYQEVEDISMNMVLELTEPIVGKEEGTGLLAERCGDGVDNDCDGLVDEGFFVGQACQLGGEGCALTGVLVCSSTGVEAVCGFPAGAVAPAELCGDALDNDCDGHVDEGFDEGGACEVGQGVCTTTGVWLCEDDGLSSYCSASPASPGVELCGDGLDNDCDGNVDEGYEDLGSACEKGALGCSEDALSLECVPGALPIGESGCIHLEQGEAGELCSVGVGVCAVVGVWICPEPGGVLTCVGTPMLPSIEVCGDGLDNDCDGLVDEGFVDLGESCEMGEGECRRLGVYQCTPGGGGMRCDAPLVSGEPEICEDGLDNDCDGLVDESAPSACVVSVARVPLSAEGCTQSSGGAYSLVVLGLLLWWALARRREERV